MAPAYKLIYFDVKALAECPRYLLHYGGIQFEDVRIPRGDWPKLKNSTPFGQLPLLERNGKQVAQSLAISRYLATVVDLAGNDDLENLEIDSIVDTINDLRLVLIKVFAVYRESDEEKKKALKEGVVKETLPFYFAKLDAVVQKNKGYLALRRLTWADFYFSSFSEMFAAQGAGGDNEAAKLDNYPNLKALIDQVNSIPAIKKWIEIRPKTER